MKLILLLAALSGPMPESHPSLRLIIHVGAGRESDIVRSELSRDHLFWLTKLAWIEQRFRIEVKDDTYNMRPSWSIGKADSRHDFRKGTFASSGSFIRSLESIVEQDLYERDNPTHEYYNIQPGYGFVVKIERPKVFPAEIEE